MSFNINDFAPEATRLRVAFIALRPKSNAESSLSIHHCCFRTRLFPSVKLAGDVFLFGNSCLLSVVTVAEFRCWAIQFPSPHIWTLLTDGTLNYVAPQNVYRRRGERSAMQRFSSGNLTCAFLDPGRHSSQTLIVP